MRLIYSVSSTVGRIRDGASPEWSAQKLEAPPDMDALVYIPVHIIIIDNELCHFLTD